MVARINIVGQIGNSYDENGNLTVKGVQLQDVISQVNANKEASILQIHINSGGGDVETGKLIANYISGLNNTFTIADELCGSIATEIHLAVPLAFRKIIAGTEYFIHNPFLQNVSGNSAELKRAADVIEPYEKEMLSMYVKATGLDKSALEGLMKQATSLTDVQAKEFGFASEILPKRELKAVAFINNNKNQNQKDMIDFKEIIADFKKDVIAVLKLKAEKDPMTVACETCIEKCKSLLATKDLPQNCIDACNKCIKTCEAVIAGMDDANMAACVAACEECIVACEPLKIPEAEACIAACKKCIELMKPMAAAPETVETLQAKLVELAAVKDLEIAKLQTEMEASLKAELETLKAEFTSTYKPNAAKPVFNAGAKKVPAPLSMKEQAAARKLEYKQK